MDDQGEPAAGASTASLRARPACRILIALPFYKNEHLVAPVLNSLNACAGELRSLGAELVCFNDSPGHAPLAAALATALPRMSPQVPCRLENNAENLGFLRTMNRAIDEAVSRHADLLLLNSDTVLEPGSVSEMVAVSRLDHMIGFVNPRSNNATLATLPLRTPPAPDTQGARDAYRALAARLPRFSFAPTAVGFCLLVRWPILAEFGGFDEVFGQGYNEENDLIMRAARCGYRAVLANHAFVWHTGEESFSRAAINRSVLEPTNRAILDARYPEYAPYTEAYYSAPETIAERLLAAALPDAQGRRHVAFDFSSFRAAHNGTFEAGRQLLQAAARVWGDDFRLHVLCEQAVYDFHDYASFGIPRADPHGGATFAAVFRVGQPYDWNVLERLVPVAAVLGIHMLDTITMDCPQLASPLLHDIWQLAIDHADVFATQSRQTSAQFRQRFELPPHAIELVCPHGLDIGEYRLPCATGGAIEPGRILVLGNHFHHKYLSRTANLLAASFPDRIIVAMGPDHRGASRIAGPLDPAPLAAADNLHIVEVGALSQAEIGAQYRAAEVVVFPSHAEGFGFPVLHALAAERPVFVRRLPVFEEIWEATNRNPNLHFFESTTDLVARLQIPPPWQPNPFPAPGNGAERSARQIRDALLQALDQVDYARIVRRIRAVQLASALARQNAMPPPSDTKAAHAARFVSLIVERITLRILGVPAFYAPARVFFHGLRRGVRLIKKKPRTFTN
jgi:GT2 family glycosyltransferase/glycosyltransferase involved in cell wall biosynthesis